MIAKIVFKSETQHYVVCPYCHEIHIHHMDFGTQDRPANCLEDIQSTYTIQGKYTLKEIAQALKTRQKSIGFKRDARIATRDILANRNTPGAADT